MCVEFMVRHIPVAKQLRFAHSVAKIISELERVGDYGESINRQAILLCHAPQTPDLGTHEELAEVAIEMVRQAIRAFLDEDIDLAEATRKLDSKANQLHQKIYRSLVGERPETSEDLSTLFSLLSVANRFERVADQASNICEEVSYLLTGEIVKHSLHREVQVLFVSSSSSCRGVMAEGIARTIAGDHFEFFSAGVDTDPPDPRAVEFLADKGIDASGHAARRLEDIEDFGRYRAVVAIGKEAAAAIPKVGFRTILLEWDVEGPDPETEAESGYASVFDALVDRITDLIRGLHGTIETEVS